MRIMKKILFQINKLRKMTKMWALMLIRGSRENTPKNLLFKTQNNLIKGKIWKQTKNKAIN